MATLQEIVIRKNHFYMKKIIASLATLTPLLALAHPGHGESEGYTIIHYFSEPQHALVTLGVVVVTGIFIVWEKKRKQKES